METLNAILRILYPLIEVVLLTVVPPLITVLAARLIQFAGVKNEQKKVEVEGQLRDALHKSIENGLLFAMTRLGINASTLPQIIAQATIPQGSDGMSTKATAAGQTLAAILDTAVRGYVVQKNPDTIEKLNISVEAIRDIALAKMQKVDVKPPEG